MHFVSECVTAAVKFSEFVYSKGLHPLCIYTYLNEFHRLQNVERTLAQNFVLI